MAELKVALLGSGASAAFAYRALMDLGIRNVDVYCSNYGSPPHGAFFLRWLPQELSERYEQDRIRFVSIGDKQTFVNKRWPHPKPEWKIYFPEVPIDTVGYDPHWLWDSLWEGASIDQIAGLLSDADIRDYGKFYSLVFHTFPSQESKREQPNRLCTPIKLYPRKSRPGAEIREIVGNAENFVLYSGDPKQEWVRLSYLFGHMALEYPVFYPTNAQSTDKSWVRWIDVPPEAEIWDRQLAPNIFPVGRMAQWDKRMLAHHSYNRILEIVKEL